MRILPLLLVVAVLFTACGGSAADAETALDATEAVAPNNSVKEQILQGTWVSVSDANVSWTFQNGQLTESLKGEQDRSQTGAYSLSDDCVNGDGNGATSPEGYLNLVNPGRCFFFVSLTPEEMAIAYVGRGNILNFRKQ